ncbi:MAG TPA: CRTAC1 family protein [Vicinamibacterales bacterium]|nr:CRTAC1 family protein [Vicinamibacterales bacterium]
MKRVRPSLALWLGLASLFSVAAQQANPPSSVTELRRQAIELLKRAEATPPAEAAFGEAIAQAADTIDRMATAVSTRADQQALREASHRLRARLRSAPNEAFSSASFVALLDRVAASDGAAGQELEFQGSYTQPTTKEPAYGGHGSAMGPPPTEMPRAAVTSPVQFEDVRCLATKTYCGGRIKDHILESGGSGVAMFDYDGDGRLDIYLVTAFELTDAREKIPHRNALYRNEGDWTFRDVSAGSGLDVAAWGSGVCAGDFDNDGRLDLYVTNFGPNFLFRNNGNGTFTDVAPDAGVASLPRAAQTASSTGPGFSAGSTWSTGCTFFDADADGDLDLYAAGYVSTSWSELARAQRTLVWRGGPKTMIGPIGLPGEADAFFENVGNGRFVEATAARGLSDTARGYGYGVLATDYDADGWVDLYVANDTSPNFLYRNRGDGHFESVGLESGVAMNGEGRAQAGMGVDSADYDGDGRLDFVVTNFAHDVNTLYRNRGAQQFEDVTSAVGLAAPTFVRMGWGTAFMDADLDGRVDLFFANGHIYPNVDDHPDLQETYRQKNQLFVNDGRRFADVSDSAGGGLQVMKSSRGLAVGDLDNDGDLDLVISNMDDVPTVLRNQQRTGHHWVGVQLRQPAGSRFCIGAQVAVIAAGKRQVREIRSGGSYLSQHDLRTHFGLGNYTGPVDVEVRMPGGRVWGWRGQPTDRMLTADARR